MKTLALAAVTLFAACGSASTTTPAMCTSFTDLTAAATPTVEFGGTLGNEYGPRCAMVKLSQSVTFQGDFSLHPISQTSGPAAITHTAGPAGVTTLVVTFPSTATYEYQCDLHHAAGMTGAIKVIP